jgi:hypothetical protein
MHIESLASFYFHYISMLLHVLLYALFQLATMQIKFLPLIYFAANAISLPIANEIDELHLHLQKRVDVTALIKSSWISVGNAYHRFNSAIQGMTSAPGGAQASGVSDAHFHIMDVLKTTMNSIRGLKPLTAREVTLDLPIAAQRLKDIEVTALNTVLRSKPIFIRTGEKEQLHLALIDQSALHAQWSEAFKSMIPTLPQSSGGMSNQVMDMYNKAVLFYA